MAKFKKGLVNDIKQEYDEEERQKKLRAKYETSDDVVIVEKDNTVKFFVRTTGNIINRNNNIHSGHNRFDRNHIS